MRKTGYEYLKETEESLSIIPYVDNYINSIYQEDVSVIDEETRQKINRLYTKLINKMYNIPHNIMYSFISEASKILQQNGIKVNEEDLYEIIQDYISEFVIQKSFYKELYEIVSKNADEKTISQELVRFLSEYDSNLKSKILYHIKSFNLVNYINEKKLQISVDNLIKSYDDEDDSNTYKIELANYIYNEASDYISDINSEDIQEIKDDIEVLLEQDIDINKSYLISKIKNLEVIVDDERTLRTISNEIEKMFSIIKTKIDVLEKLKSFILENKMNYFYDLSSFYKNYFMKDLEVITKIKGKDYYEKTKEGKLSIEELVASVKSDYDYGFIDTNKLVCKDHHLYLLHSPFFYSIVKLFNQENKREIVDILVNTYTEFDNLDIAFIIRALQNISFNAYEKQYNLLKNLERLREEYKSYTDKVVSYSTIETIDSIIFLYRSISDFFISNFDSIIEKYEQSGEIDRLYFAIVLVRFINVALDFCYFAFYGIENFYDFISDVIKVASIDEAKRSLVSSIPGEYFYRILESKKGKGRVETYYLDLPFFQTLAYRIKYYLLTQARKSLYYIYGDNLTLVLENEKANIPKYGRKFYEEGCNEHKEAFHRLLSFYAYTNKKFNSSIYNLGLKKFWRYFMHGYLIKFYQNERIKNNSKRTTKENIMTYDKDSYLQRKGYMVRLDTRYEHEIFLD